MTRRTSADTLVLSSWWHRFKAKGCQASRDSLIQHYRYLVIKTRQRIIPAVPHRISQSDLETEGLIALVRAVDSYDPERKVKFESFAISTIRGAMLEYLRREDWVPRSIRSKQKLLKKAEEEIQFTRGVGRVTEADLADHLGMDPDALRQLCRECHSLQLVRLEEVQGESDHEDAEPLVLRDSIRSQDPQPDQLAAQSDERRIVRRCVDWLPQAERTVVDLYYFGGMTLKDIARRLSKSESRAHQLHTQALGRLKGYVTREIPVG